MKREQLNVESINHMTDVQQVEAIANEFAKARNVGFTPLRKEDILIHAFSECDIPVISVEKVKLHLSQLKTKTSQLDDDIPSRVLKVFSSQIAVPLTNIINTSIKRGEWPDCWKTEYATPIPKEFPIKDINSLRNISGLKTCDKIAEKIISELIIEDMKNKLDPSQYANQPGVSIDHYLVKLVHKILVTLDNSSRGETLAVLATLIDWKQAFPKQCPKIGIESFIKNGVRPSLIPVLINYFQKRQLIVKWHNVKSVAKDLTGGGPQGGTLGVWEYQSNSNDNANCVKEDSRFKWVDDLTILEIINLLSIGITSYNIKHHVPSDILENNQFIPKENLQSQTNLDTINEWTKSKKMELNERKTKNIIFNFTKKYQVSTRLSVNEKNIETFDSVKLLGTIVENNLKWEENTASLVKRAHGRMQLLRKVASFSSNTKDLLTIYKIFIRSVLEQTFTVWHSSLTRDLETDIERVQKCALRIILGKQYKSYKEACNIAGIEDLVARRTRLCLKFAKKCLHNPKMTQFFPQNCKKKNMITRHQEKYQVLNAHTERLKKSAIPYMQRLLNKDNKLSEEG